MLQTEAGACARAGSMRPRSTADSSTHHMVRFEFVLPTYLMWVSCSTFVSAAQRAEKKFSIPASICAVPKLKTAFPLKNGFWKITHCSLIQLNRCTSPQQQTIRTTRNYTLFQGKDV